MKVTFTIEGAAELERNLATLGQRVHRKVIRTAVRAAQKPVLDASKRNARSMVGGEMGALLSRNIVRRAAQRQRPGSYAIHVQIRSDVPEFRHISRGGRETFIPSAIEYGHGMEKGSVAIPFMRRAAESTRSESMRLFSRELRAGLLREAIRARYR